MDRLREGPSANKRRPPSWSGYCPDPPLALQDANFLARPSDVRKGCAFPSASTLPLGRLRLARAGESATVTESILCFHSNLYLPVPIFRS
jgi:hypothetical protein